MLQARWIHPTYTTGRHRPYSRRRFLCTRHGAPTSRDTGTAGTAIFSRVARRPGRAEVRTQPTRAGTYDALHGMRPCRAAAIIIPAEGWIAHGTANFIAVADVETVGDQVTAATGTTAGGVDDLEPWLVQSKTGLGDTAWAAV